MFLPPHAFRHVETLYDQSLYVRAYHAAEAIAPLEVWQGTTARLLAGRIAATVGAPTLGRQQQLRAYRHDPQDWEARYYFARMVLRYRGAWAAWQFLQQHDSDPTLATAEPKVHSDWLAFHAFVLAQFRDFERAETWLARAEKVAPDNVWVWVERANVFELQARHDDALAVLRYALILQPWFRPTIQTSARALVQQGREEEALRLLAQAAEHIECAWIVEQLAQLQIELGQFAEAQQSFARYAELTPRLEPELREQLLARCADVAYLSGDYAAAIAFAQQCAAPALHKFAAQLENGVAPGHRVLLPVNVVAHNERAWAAKNGYAACEFRVTWESAVELLKRKIVFTLHTVEAGNAHSQMVVGYDLLRRALLVRAPSQRQVSEWNTKINLERFSACGPRGLALVPLPQAQLLHSLPLLETEQYNALYAVQDALAKQDRAQAQGQYQTMEQRFGEHRLTLEARLALAQYDDDPAARLHCYEKLAEMFPADTSLQFSLLQCRREQATRAQRLGTLQTLCAEKSAAPWLWREYAQTLREDARAAQEALRGLRKAFRRGLLDAATLHLLADIEWQQQRRAEAMELYRFAACLEDDKEQSAQAFFQAAQQQERSAEAWEFLAHRAQHAGHCVPTWFQALVQSDCTEEAFAALETGLTRFPTNGRLKLFAAETYARWGKFDQADAQLRQAQPYAAKSAALRTAAIIATLRGQESEALLHWGQLLELEPLALDANQHVVQLLTDTDSARAAVEFLRERTIRFPHSTRLRVLLIEALYQSPARAETELRFLLKHDPTNDWALRTLAGVLLKLRRSEEALTASEAACRQPGAENHFVRGQVLLQLERQTEARAAFRSAITLSAAHLPALVHFVAASTTPEEQREAVLFIAQELTAQTTTGEGWLTFCELAQGVFSPEELQQRLRRAVQERPDLRCVWSALSTQLLRQQQIEEAVLIARQAVDRFPLAAPAWFDLALCCEAKAEAEAQSQALRHALQLDPAFLPASQKLAELYEQSNQWAQARRVLERAMIHAPFQAFLPRQLAALCWKLGEQETAVKAMRRALTLAPDHDRGWQQLAQWAEQMQQPLLPLRCARELTEQRPGDPRAWLALARILCGEESLPERLAALERAIALHPQLLTAHSLRIALLAQAGRYDEALRACRPTVLAPTFPPELLSEEAYLTAQCGDLAGALKKMRTLLTTTPDFALGWERMARWYRTLEQSEEYLEAAQQLARLQPQSAIAHGYLGEAKLRNGDRAGAKESLAHAVSLAPDYGFAALLLFDLQLADNDLHSARAALERLEQHVGGNETTLRVLKLAARNQDAQQVEQSLRVLCEAPANDSALLEQASEILAATEFRSLLDTVFEEALSLPQVNPHVGTLWVQRCAAQNKPDHCLRRLHEMAARTPDKLWHNAAAAFLEISALNGAADPVQQFIRQYQALLQAEPDSWGAVGAALYHLGEAQAVVDWLRDWQERAGVTPETLWYLALALRDLRQEHEAHAVSLHAIRLPADPRTNSHLAILSLDETLAGRLENARQHTARIAPNTMNEWDQVMVTLATDLHQFHHARREGHATAQAVLDHLLELARQTPWLQQSRMLVQLFQRVVENVLTTENDALLKIKTRLKLKWFEYRASV